VGAVDGRVVEDGLLVAEDFVTLGVVFDGRGVSFKVRGVSLVPEVVFGAVGVLEAFSLLPVAGREVTEDTLELCGGPLFGVPTIQPG